jgi:hypothetical protein
MRSKRQRQIQNIEAAAAVVNRPGAEWIKVIALEEWLDSWGTESKRSAPCVWLSNQERTVYP